MRRFRLAAVLAILAPLTVQADVLVLRNGSRVQGELIAVRGGVIEFEEQRGFGGRRTIRVDREEVARIELDRSDGGGGGDSGYQGGGGGRPSGMRERSISVGSTLSWSDTGIDLRAGQTIYFEASGNVRWGRDRRDGPEGENDSPNNPNRPIPNRPAAGLIGRVGGGSDYFFIGAESVRSSHWPRQSLASPLVITFIT
jgi:hypothetical protein